VSEGSYASLNCGRGSRDRRDRVEENRERVASVLGIPPAFLVGPRQVHSAACVVATEPWHPAEAPEADAVVTERRGLAVSVLTADCVPVLLADREAGVVAAAHAGWRGTLAGIVESTLSAMVDLGARLERISAAIGPAISADSYEVGPEFKAAFIERDARNAIYFEDREGRPRPHFDLPACVRDRLLGNGVRDVEDIAICTYRNESRLFSHRRSVHRAEPDYGRQISAILIA
jgi:YfiH family protein